MGPSPSSRQSTLPMKTREITPYASHHILCASQPAGVGFEYLCRTSGGVNSESQHSNSVVHPADVSRQTLAGESSPFLSIETGSTMPRTPHRPIRDAGGYQSQNKERRVDKRNAKIPASTSLTKALSEIAHDVLDINVTDVATFAHRSVKDRQAEATKAGKVKRPLNAFMLYRKAYQDVAKTQCSRNNHQQVSTVCGSSWNNWEPPGVIAHFKQLASVEKQMHERAFPAYKYDPVQAKKPKDTVDQDSRACDVSDGESNCRPRRSGRQRTTRGTSRVRQSYASEVPDQYHGLQGIQSRLPGGPWQQYHDLPVPEWYAHDGVSVDATQYTPHGAGQRADDPGAGVSYGCTSSDLPFQPYPNFVDPCLDPSLQAEAPGSHYGQFLGANHEMLPDWMHLAGAQNAPTSLVPDLDNTGAHTAYLQGTESDWQVEQLEEGCHFSDWMTQAGPGEQQ